MSTTETPLRRPVVVDTELADIYEAEMKLAQRLGWKTDELLRMAGAVRVTHGYRHGFEFLSFDGETRAVVGDAFVLGAKNDYEARRFEQAKAEWMGLMVEASALRDRKEPLQAEFRADPWTRFFLVTDGHIHSSMECSTCNKGHEPTLFGWLPELSGLTESD